MLLLLLILVIPIINWFALKSLRPKTKSFKRFLLWFATTWIAELVVLITAFAIA